MGEYLRQNGDVDLAPKHDNWVRIALSTATPATVALAEIPHGETVILASDGLDDISHDELEAFAAEHEGNPQALADSWVAAACADEKGYRDDATVAVLLPIPASDDGQADAPKSLIEAAELEFVAARDAGDDEGVNAALQKMRDAGVPAIVDVLEDAWAQRGR